MNPDTTDWSERAWRPDAGCVRMPEPDILYYCTGPGLPDVLLDLCPSCGVVPHCDAFTLALAEADGVWAETVDRGRGSPPAAHLIAFVPFVDGGEPDGLPAAELPGPGL